MRTREEIERAAALAEHFRDNMDNMEDERNEADRVNSALRWVLEEYTDCPFTD